MLRDRDENITSSFGDWARIRIPAIHVEFVCNDLHILNVPIKLMFEKIRH